MSPRQSRNRNPQAGLSAGAQGISGSASPSGSSPSRRSPRHRHNDHDSNHPNLPRAASLSSSTSLNTAVSAVFGAEDEAPTASNDSADAVDKIAPPADKSTSLKKPSGLLTPAEIISHASPSKTKHSDKDDDDDDDEAYDAVDLISESDGEGEEPDMEAAEERNIIDNLEHSFDLHQDSSLFPGDMPYFTEQMQRIVHDNLAEHASKSDTMRWPVFGPFPSAPSPPPPTPTTTTRRVRFDTSCLMTPRSADGENVMLGNDLLEENLQEAFAGFSGYDSDGETTDEDEIPINTTKSPRALLVRQPFDTDWDDMASPIETPEPPRPLLPRVATWTVHPGKALGQSDERNEVVIMTPINPHARCRGTSKSEADLPPTPLVTGRLQRSSASSQSKTSSTPAQADVMKSVTNLLDPLPLDLAASIPLPSGSGAEPLLVPESTQSSTFVPASKMFEEIDFTVANSDHESTDLDILDYMTFSSESDDEDNEDEVTLDLDDNTELDDSLKLRRNSSPKHTGDTLLTPALSHKPASPSSTDASHLSPGPVSSRNIRKLKSPVQTRRPHNGLALTKPASSIRGGHLQSKFDRKRKLSDAHMTHYTKRPNLRNTSRSAW